LRVVQEFGVARRPRKRKKLQNRDRRLR
jgi:hypothetical protein